ncbi:MAG: polysaccharide deacetylase family protein, partial [Thermoplasmata archaeon]|nr:polysaccharide deacetylase family protein [Thermoplasmata archaeon]
SHGYKHQHLLNRRAEAQREDIVKSTRVIEGLTGEKVRQFRAPNFSASGTTVAILEDLGYRVDSSVLPGRKMRHFGIFTLYDFRKAPRDIYHPSTMDITKRDGMDIVEIPPTENPLLRGAPLGMGFLNKFGIEKTQQAISEVGEEYVTFLIHSWEFVDLAKNERGSAKNLRELCKNNVTGLSSLLRFLDDSWRIVSLMELCEMWAGTQNEKTISG